LAAQAVEVGLTFFVECTPGMIKLKQEETNIAGKLLMFVGEIRKVAEQELYSL
jgi:hypothetical protein